MKRSTQYIIVGAVAFVVLLGALFIVSNNQGGEDGRQVASAITPEATQASEVATAVFRDGGEETPAPDADKPPVDGGETPPDGGELPPPPDGGEVTPPPVDGGELPPPPDGGELPPPPDGGEAPPVDGGELPPPPSGPDDDGDGVLNDQDLCPSIAGNSAEQPGCPPDDDGDGVYSDLCPSLGDAFGTGVDQFGCPNKVATLNGNTDGLTVSFSGSGAGGDITGYEWSFGDGATSTEQNPTHTYGSAGDYSVSLTVIFSNGARPMASNTFSVSEPVAEPVVQAELELIAEARTASIDASINGLTVSFSGSGTGEGITGYSWSFGDGTTSTEQNPTHTYASAGIYTISLTVLFSEGENPTATTPIDVGVVVAAPGSSCAINAPSYTQSGNSFTVSFSATGDNIESYSWDFGGGNVVSGQNAEFTYTGEGNYDYTLTCAVADGVLGSGGANGADYVLTGSVNVTASEATSLIIVAGFNANRGSGENGFTLVLTNVTSTNPAGTALTYNWSVTGPGGYSQTRTTSTLAETASFVLDGGIGDYSITLEATNGTITARATGTVQVIEQVARPNISLTISPREGQSPFEATISVNNSGGEITSYAWNFGGGELMSGDTSTSGPFVVRFTGTSGQSFNVSVTVEGPGGGANASQSVVILGQREAARASFDARTEKIGDNLFRVCFTNTTAGDYDSASWNFGNGVTLDTMDLEVCQEYAGGTYTVELAIIIPGGSLSTSSRLLQVIEGIQPPTVRITASNTSVNVGQTVNFQAVTTGAIRTYAWTFGEFGSSDQANPSITFNQAGTFVVNLRVEGPGGTAEAAAVNIEVAYRNISCSITGFSATPSFNQSVSYGVNIGNLQGRTPTYEWTFTTPSDVQTGAASSFTASYPVAGAYSIALKVFIDGTESCSISRAASLTLNQVTCAVKGNISALLGNNTYDSQNVNNLNGRTVTSKEWTLSSQGGGSIASGTSSTFSYNFAEPGSVFDLAMKLFVSDGTFCERTITITVGASALSCNISGDNSASQFGSKNYRANVSGGSGGITYSWTGSNGVTFNSTTARDVRIYFPESGSTDVTVTITRGNDVCTPSKTVGVGGKALECTLNANVVEALLNQTTSFNVTFKNLGQRVATYKWYINEVGQESYSGGSVAHKWTIDGSQTAKVEVYLDGAETPACVLTKTVNVSVTEVVCSLSGNSSFAPFTSGFANVNVTAYELAGFTFNWTVNGESVQNSTASRFDFPADVMSQPNTTFSLGYEVKIGEQVYCAETKIISIGADNFSCTIVAPDAIYNGENASFRVNVGNANGRQMNYTWYLNGEQVGEDNANFSTIYNGENNSIDLRLVGVTVDGSGTCEVSANVRVEAAQSISATANPNSGLVGLVSVFDAITVNINRSTLKWFYPDGSSEVAEQGRYVFTEPGTYTIRVTGVGPLRTQEASVVVVVYGETSLIASFVADPWEAVAPRTICFTDKSTVTGNPITSWEWTFEGGEPATSNEQNPCIFFPTVGEKQVTLGVANDVLNGRATNKVTLFALVDDSAYFNVDIRGNGEVCFTGVVSSGVNIAGWNFGDGSTGEGQTEICHTYADGTYNVQMLISRDGTNGIVPRNIRVDSSLSTAEPILNRGLVCDANGTATFTVANVGGPMTVNGTVSAVSDGAPVTIADNTFTLGTGQSKSFTASGLEGKSITFSTDANGGNLTASVECEDPKPIVRAVGICANGGASFTLTNSGGDMLEDMFVTIKIGDNVVATETIRLAANGETTVNASGFGIFSLSTTGGGIPSVTASTTSCTPALTLTSICWQTPNEHQFHVSNGNNFDVPFTWDVFGTTTNGSGTATANSDTFFTITGTYGGANTTRLFVGGTLVQTKAVNENLCEGVEPRLTAAGVCDANGSVTFVITNVSKFPMTESKSYTVTNSTGTLVNSSVTLAGEGELELTYDNQKGETLVLTVEGIELPVSAECPPKDPALTFKSICESDGVAKLTITNSSTAGDMLDSDSIFITNEEGEELTANEGNDYQLKAGESKTFTVSNQYNQTVYFYKSDETLVAEVTCAPQDYELVSEYQCIEGQTTFTVTNNGAGDMLSEAYVTFTANGTDVTPADNAFQLAAGENKSFQANTVTFNQVVSVSVTGGDEFVNVTDLDKSINCDPERYELQAKYICEAGTATLTVTNNGAGDMLSSATVSVTKDGEPVTLDDNSFQLNSDESKSFSVPNAWNATYAFSVTGGDSEIYDVTLLDGSVDCEPQPYTLAIESLCEAGELSFLVTNQGEGDMLTPHNYSITTDAGEVDLGSFILSAGEKREFVVSGVFNTEANFNSTLDEGTEGEPNITLNQQASLTDSVTCLPQPYELVVVELCESGVASFVVTNNGDGDMLLPHNVVIVDSNTFEVLFSGGSFQLNAGESSESFSISDQWNKTVVFQSEMQSGEDSTLPLNQIYSLERPVECTPQPYLLTVTGICESDGVAKFTVTNTGPGEMLQPDTFSISTSKNVNLTPVFNEFFLASGESVEISVSSAYDSIVTFEAQSEGIVDGGSYTESRLTTDVECAPPPAGLCYPNRVIATSQGLTNLGNPVAPIRSNPAAALGTPDGDALGTFYALGLGGSIELGFDGVLYDEPGADFQIFETTWLVNGQLPTPSNYPERIEVFVAYKGGAYISVGTAFLDSSFDIAVSGLSYIDRIKIVDITDAGFFGEAEVDGYDVDAVHALTCGELPPPPVCTDPTCYDEPPVTPEQTPTPEPTEPPTVGICGETLVMGSGKNITFPMINLSNGFCAPQTERPVVDWRPVVTGEGICVDWLAYHTNITGDWEIFRLGEFPEGFGYNVDADVNMSKGYGERISDIGPARSPDAKFLAFASNRDGNWEIYVSPVDGTLEDQQRVTYNDSAIDLDPVWSPDGTKLAYESNVDGNWEIRLLDLLTGEKYRLTDNPANDINPFWGDNGTKLLFQSDREDGLWQIYELDVTDFNNTVVTRLTSTVAGVDYHDAQYSNDNTRIVFRGESLDANGALQSIIYIMDLATQEITQVSVEGADARNFSWSPDDTLIAYQSDADGDTPDIYVYEVATGTTRLLTENTEEYAGNINTAPTWICESTTVVFASDVIGNNEIFSVSALPIDGAPIKVDQEASQLTNDEANDRDPQNAPAEENASRNGLVPPKSQ